MERKVLPLALLMLLGTAALAKDSDKIVSPPAAALPVLHPSTQIQLPLDELLVQRVNLNFAFLATLDSSGKPRSLLLLNGDEFFVPEVSASLQQQTFDRQYANRQVIIEGSVPPDPEPLPKGLPTITVLQNALHPTPADQEKIKATLDRRSQVEPCSESMDEYQVIRLGNRYRRLNRKEAYQCFQVALTKTPASLAALSGASVTCDEKGETGCRIPYLAQLLALRPDDYRDRVELARERGAPQGASSRLAEMKKILKENPPPPVELAFLNALIFSEHEAGNIPDEIAYRRQWSEIARKYFALYPTKFGNYSRIGIVFNDEPLALHLEGMQQWTEAEDIYRRNLPMIEVDPLFEKKVRFDNELGLARALAGQGKSKEAAQVCSDAKGHETFDTGTKIPGADNKQVARAMWDLACGKEQDGLAMLQSETVAHPWNTLAHDALRNYYYGRGDLLNARKEDAEYQKSSSLLDARTLADMR